MALIWVLQSNFALASLPEGSEKVLIWKILLDLPFYVLSRRYKLTLPLLVMCLIVIFS